MTKFYSLLLSGFFTGCHATIFFYQSGALIELINRKKYDLMKNLHVVVFLPPPGAGIVITKAQKNMGCEE
ncbi:hypothetical protein D6029_03085 [Buttiauxella izardii]|uniref:Lipoprotein n=1 Tax=Buttiauxella izardii TaxID=82991 RepID=A0A3A5JUT7_9ENTR|nr:hypothetical protein D6029_03085 [Buttiauxella izardii]